MPRQSRRWWLIVLFAGLAANVLRAAPTTAPTSRPTATEIADTLDRVRAHLDASVGVRLLNRATSQPVTDLSVEQPLELTLEPGTQARFGPYSYPMGVVYSGMILAHQVTGDQKYADFVSRRFQVFADNLPVVEKWSPEQQRKTPFRGMLKPGNLDACGAMGAAMIQARRAKVGPDLKWVIDRFAEYVSKGQFRASDGTLARKRPAPASVWCDDAYMGIPILAQMGQLTGETPYFDDAARQMKQMSARLFVPGKGLYTHGWTQDKPASDHKYYWGRANGWCMMALVELLDVLPEDHPSKPELLELLRAHAKGLAAVQDESGLWHQLLDRPDSFLETSASAMFTMGMARGINRGWLDAATYTPAVEKAWRGITTRVSPDGKVAGTCPGTNYRDDDDYYFKRPCIDDVHGYGPVLLAGAEMLRLERAQEQR